MSDERSADLFRHALMYREWGMSVFPVGGQKIPTVRWKGRQTRRPTLDKLGRDFGYVHPVKGPATGIAVVHGKVSGGLACRDFDAADAYRQWADAFPSAAATLPTVATPRGFHVWFRCRDDQYIAGADGELRADSRHYTILPPSYRTDRSDGFTYHWLSTPPNCLNAFPLVSPSVHGLAPTPVTEPPHPTVEQSYLTTPASAAPPLSPLNDKYTNSPPDYSYHYNTDQFDHRYRESILSFIRETMPEKTGERNRCLFRFSGRLKSLEQDVGAGYWMDAVRVWWGNAYPVIGTKEFAVSWEDFRRGWHVSLPWRPSNRGANDVLTAARMEAAKVSGSDAKMRAVCRKLGGGANDFMLASTLAADLTGLSQQTAYNTLMRMVRRRELVVTERSEPMTKGVGHRYRYTGDGSQPTGVQPG